MGSNRVMKISHYIHETLAPYLENKAMLNMPLQQGGGIGDLFRCSEVSCFLLFPVFIPSLPCQTPAERDGLFERLGTSEGEGWESGLAPLLSAPGLAPQLLQT